MRRAAGFTLIEVLVALSIVAIALVAGAQATAALTNNAQRQADVLLGHLCAENELARLRLAGQLPGVGDNELPCEQAGRVYQLRVTVSPTPNPSFRRVDAQVFDGTVPILRLSTVQGRY
ncbi:MAG TPA: type II secretion system minor pseudopilin GspI [Ramlibacter sp.]